MDIYDMRYPASNYTSQKLIMEEYFSNPAVHSHIHIEASQKFPKFSSMNHTIHQFFRHEDTEDSIPQIETILEHHIPLVLYVGQFDRSCGMYGTQEWMK
jgi:hypothetical protein